MAKAHRRLPAFDSDGLLPVGEHVLTLVELAGSFLVHGPRGRNRTPNWDAQWRSQLVENLSVLAAELAGAGIVEIFVNGSFVEAKTHPNDIDGYFVCDRQRLVSGRLERELNRISARKCWTWESADRQPVPSHGRKLPDVDRISD